MENTTQYELLQSNPDQLLSSKLYQENIQKVVYHFVKKGWIQPEIVDDFVQDINRDFIEKQLVNIRKNYQPHIGSLMDYFIRSVYNKCWDLVRKQNQYSSREIATDHPSGKHPSDHSFHPESALIEQEVIQNECNKLKLYLDLTPRIQGRIDLFLKVFCRVMLNEQDFIAYSNFYGSKIPFKILKTALHTFGNDYSKLPNNQLFEKLRPLIKNCEKKNIQANGIIKWLNRYVEQLIDALNQNSFYVYDKESLKNLLRIYYKK